MRQSFRIVFDPRLSQLVLEKKGWCVWSMVRSWSASGPDDKPVIDAAEAYALSLCRGEIVVRTICS